MTVPVRLDQTKVGQYCACEHCEEIMPGSVREEVAYDVERAFHTADGDYVTQDELETWVCTLYFCPDGCRTSDESTMWDLPELWMCGECNQKYSSSHEASECC